MDQTLEDKVQSQRVQINVAEALLSGKLQSQRNARGVVVFPHGRGTSRGAHDGFLASKLREAGLSTLLLDLLTPEEADLDARKAAFRFDIGLLGARLAAATDWLADQTATRGLVVGYFGSGYGAAAALVAAAKRPNLIRAVVCHDSPPDLTHYALARVAAPTLIIGEIDQTSLQQLGAKDRHLVHVPGPAHAAEDVARLAAEWFATNCRQGSDCRQVQHDEGLPWPSASL